MREIDFAYDKIISKNKPMRLYIFGDTHVGNEGFDEKLLKKHINMCKREGAYWVHTGDWVEAIVPIDKRFDIRAEANSNIMKQYKRVRKLFEPIKDMCIGVIAGNHDEKVSVFMGDCVEELICDDLDVNYLGYMGKINLKFKHSKKAPKAQHTFSILLHHGRGGGRKIGGKVNNLIDMGLLGNANMYIMGHFHIFNSHIDSSLDGKLRYYVAVPAYLDAYAKEETNYVKRGAYTRQPVGCVVVELYRNGDDIAANVKPLLKGM